MDEKIMGTREKKYSTLYVEKREVYSAFLERDVRLDVYLPVQNLSTKEISLLLINDGQDLRTMDFGLTLDALIFSDTIQPLMCVGIHCGMDRLHEYGTICRPDYKGRGSKAGLYNRFIFDELLPFLKEEFNVSFKEKSFAGFSLGGLSAMDMAWNQPMEFTKVGVFSGSLWWRRRGYEDKGFDLQKDRIMHLQVQKGRHCKWLRFFFECGLLDETADRDNNGIIDSIEDVTDLIRDMKEIGYTDDQIRYLELEDGRHDIETWSRAFPEFLKWGWGI